MRLVARILVLLWRLVAFLAVPGMALSAILSGNGVTALAAIALAVWELGRRGDK